MNRPIRTEYTETKIHVPWEPIVHLTGATETHHYLNEEGGIESHTTLHLQPMGCGHLASAGGTCSQCSRTSCPQCFKTCLLCHCPVGRCCFQIIRTATEEELFFCKACYGKVKRRKIFRNLISGIIRFD